MTRRGEKGGALLEVIIAIGITAMLAAAVTQTGRFGLTVIERTEAAASASGLRLSERRRLADLLTRIDAEGPDRPAFAGAETSMRWRGVAPDGAGGWRAGIWRLVGSEAGLVLSRCDSLEELPDCEEEDRFAAVGPFAYADPGGAFVDNWPPGAPPALIRLGPEGGLTAQPRVAGARR